MLEFKLRQKKIRCDSDSLSDFIIVVDKMEIVPDKLNRGQMWDPILTVRYPQVYSEHLSERAPDAGSVNRRKDLRATFADTSGGRWLEENAGRFRVELVYPNREGRKNRSNYAFKPWHVLFTAVARAGAPAT